MQLSVDDRDIILDALLPLQHAPENAGQPRRRPKPETYFWSSVTPRSFTSWNRRVSQPDSTPVSGDRPELYDKRGC